MCWRWWCHHKLPRPRPERQPSGQLRMPPLAPAVRPAENAAPGASHGLKAHPQNNDKSTNKQASCSRRQPLQKPACSETRLPAVYTHPCTVVACAQLIRDADVP